MTSYMKPMISPLQRPISFSALVEFVKTLDPAGLDIAVAASRVTNYPGDFHPHPSLFVASSLLVMSTIISKGAAGDIDSVRDVPDPLFKKLLAVSSAADGMADSGEPRSDYEFIQLLSRVVGLQTALQGDLLCRLVRFSYILGLIEHGLPGIQALPVPEYLGSHGFTWATLQDQYTLLFWLLSSRQHGLSFTIDDLTRSSRKSPRLSEIIGRALPELGFTVSEARTHWKRCEKRGIVGFAIPYDLMARKPLLILDGQRYLRMPSAFQQLAASHGLFFRYRQFLLKESRKGNKLAETAMGVMGQRFEEYCRILLGECLHGMESCPEVAYGKSEKRSPDGMFFSESSGQLVVMQAKLKPPTGGLLLGDTSIDFTKSDLENAYGEMFCESIRFLQEMKRLHSEGRIPVEVKRHADCVMKARKIILICLAPTIPPVFHWGPGLKVLKQAIRNKLRKESPSAYRTFMNWQGKEKLSSCLLLTDPEPFEIHSYKCPDVSILPSLERWWRNVKGMVVSEQGFPQDFRDFVVDCSSELQPTSDQLVGSLWNNAKALLDEVLGIDLGA